MRSGLHGVVLVIMFVLMAPISAHAVQPDEVLADAALEQRARALSANLRCVVCQNQSIDDSDAPLARDLRLLVRERLVTGDTDAEVIDFVVARYGEFVLLKPRFGAHTAVLWLLPFLVLGGAVGWMLFRRRRTVVDVTQSPVEGLDEDEERRLAEVLGGKRDG